ncbi:hypothetical protein [Trinickia diaoshuihuensis]|uniref:hypothetical protein n=1 Tax=Trinickia diaoshuihuensis TaxID=2292265 RepID=UPI000E278644|nr:hypothetical protein [Trinickia diaoshuihuensis]
MACTAAASGSFVAATYAWRALDADSRAASAAAIETMQARLHESRATLARLPEARRRAREAAPAASASHAAGAQWHAVAELASRTGVRLRTLAPASGASGQRVSKGSGAPRTLRVDGEAGFSQLFAFFTGLSSLPMLVVPEAVDIKHDKGSLALGATFGLFDKPPMPIAPTGEASAADRDAALASASLPANDPFGPGEPTAYAGARAGRLVGVMRGAGRALALWEAPGGSHALAAEPGETVGMDRLVSIDAAGVTLAGSGQPRRVSMSENKP